MEMSKVLRNDDETGRVIRANPCSSVVVLKSVFIGGNRCRVFNVCAEDADFPIGLE